MSTRKRKIWIQTISLYRFLLWVGWAWWGLTTACAAPEVFVRSRVNRSLLNWGEPCLLTLSVYTRTWFTEGVAFPEMYRQQGVLLKKGRSFTHQEEIQGERYSVVEQCYWYYPLETGEHTIRFGEIIVVTPPVGAYKGVARKLVFKDMKVEVNLPPKGMEQRIVAGRLKLSQQWSRADTLKVGEVVTRTLTYRAEGVPAAFIAVQGDSEQSEAFRSVAEPPVYATRMYDRGISGEAVQRILYQLNDTGYVKIPSYRVVYWNLRKQMPDTVWVEGKALYVSPSSWKQQYQSEEEEAETSSDWLQEWVRKYGLKGGILCLFFYGVKRGWGRQHRGRLLFRMLCCRKPACLYDLLYLYAVCYMQASSFCELARGVGVPLSAWYTDLERAIFTSARNSKWTWWKQIRLVVFLFVYRCKRN